MQHRPTPTRWLHSGQGVAAYRAAWLGSCVFAAFLGTLAALNAASLRVEWDPSPDSAVVGYKVSMGTRSGVYTVVVDAGTQTVEQFTDLTAGATYYFVVQAYDRVGNLSPPSAEVAGTAPLGSVLTITCPVPAVTSWNGMPVVMTFSPTTTGGALPIQVSCSPPSGSFFSIGATPVLCTARDVTGAFASCLTSVVVVAATQPRE